ncbi:MAG: PH domain-containing protein [Muribaculaceae bacterium]|nr:PH domain-containing protein [Muribaculaceae bacterium]
MTKKVKYSSATIAWTLLLIAAYAATAIYFVKREDTIVWVGLIVVISVWNIFALLYAPLSVSVDANTLNIYTVLRRKRIRIADIASAELCTPTMAEKKILSSGGYFGYWGWFSERDLGKYFAYYGKSSDCFLVRLRNGRQYMLGCDEPGAVVDCIKAQIAVKSACRGAEAGA